MEGNDMERYLHEALELSSEVDTTLDRFSEKLTNLENLLPRFLAEENGIVANDFENDEISEELIEKALTFDLLSAMLSFELREVDDLMGCLQDRIVDALRKISSCENSTELLNIQRRLHGSEELLKQSRDRVLEMKIQELELERKFKELKQNEDDLKLKVRLVEQVAFCMEEAAEVAWGRFLEADNTAEILMGISKDTLGKLHLAQFDLIRSSKREEEKTRQLHDLTNHLHSKNTLIENLNTEIAEVNNLREKVKKLEKNLEITQSKLEEANASNETSERRVKEKEGEIEALKEKIYATESRAESAEEKSTHLTESNLELSEEVDFLKGANDSNSKKVSVLEKQLRELDIQFQHSRALSEAGQEQQNMLYSAIWDMETLIDELKQKVAKAENKTESAEERCVVLSETNSDIGKELEFMRSRVELLEKALSRANVEKKTRANDISVRSGRIMDTLISCTKENKILREKLRKDQKNASVILQNNKRCGEKEFQLSKFDSTESASAKVTAVNTTEISSENLQAGGEKLPGGCLSPEDG
ncbi:WPP domain-interacting tail-anchored protein 2 [Phtheirospermum japonicum]|uniref:WPP domain-interacting tail-anchored protein 2 n=1 Tax=Phtheirospermum japonicum TaxID=374723 RepID=A0A830BZ29_9LAMI|nr:WPP domain-interacting tail-anchored protein 2 [Phtheirospermum japonicum]